MREIRGWLELALVATILVGAFMWIEDCQGFDQKVETLRDSISAASARVDSLKARQARADSAWAADSARWHRRFDSLATVAREAEEEAEEAGEQFELVGDSLRNTLELIAERFPGAEPLVDTAMAQVERRDVQHALQVENKNLVIGSLRETLRGKDTLIAKLRGRVADRDSTIAGLERENAHKDDLIAEYEDRLDINFVEKVFRDPAVKAAIAAVFYFAGQQT